ncbi:MAG: sugar-binding domain-containing protein [Mariniphaga sp.]
MKGILFYTLLIAGILTSSKLLAQNKLNFGLNQPQDKTTLPVSLSKPVVSERKLKVAIPASLQKVSENEFILNSGWEMSEADQLTASGESVFDPKLNTSRWYNATVPGTVLTTLVEQGVYPDPYFGLNNLYIPDSLCRKDWWYRLAVKLPENISGKFVWLLFNGINYKADVWLNGKLLGRISGAFHRGEFDATPFVKSGGSNILAVHIFPPHNPGIPQEESSKTNAGPNGGQLCLDGPTFISSEGWDWVPGIRDRNIGIWQDVRLRLTDGVSIIDPQVITDLPLPDTTSVTLTIKSGIKNYSAQSQQITLAGTIDQVEFSKTLFLKPNESRTITLTSQEFPQLILKNPRLWWPNGYGRQEFYQLNLQAKLGGKGVSDQKIIRFGVREFSYEMAVAQPEKKMWRIEFNPIQSAGKVLFNNIDRVDVGNGIFLPQLVPSADPSLLTSIDKDSKNPFLTIKVNGVPIFCKGGNWGMDDGMKRVSRERLEPYFKLHQLANFNMVRNWTGESTEELFYDLCDEYGLLVWNDFWLSTEGYNLNVNDNQLFMANATDVVKRFRNHASIAIWCPRNEGYAPLQIEPQLTALIANEDGTRHYQPNSRNLNLRPSGPWHYLKDGADYYKTIAEGFSTELGTPSVPTAATIRSFMPVEDQWPISDTWFYHDLHEGQKEYLRAIETKYGISENLDDFCKKAQMVNYDSHRAMFESWNSKLWNKASGILLWMTHPAWPSMVWQTYSWDYETFGSFYGAKKACEPVHIQMNLNDHKVVVINTSLKGYKQLTSKLEVYDLNGKKLSAKSISIAVPANKLADCYIAELPSIPQVYMVRLTLSDKSKVLSQNDYLVTNEKEGRFDELNQLAAASLSAKIGKQEHRGKEVITISNSGKVPVIGVKLNLRDPQSGKIVLPANFSDGYFTLLPGEKKQVEVEWNSSAIVNAEVIAEAYNLKRQGIAFVK